MVVPGERAAGRAADRPQPIFCSAEDEGFDQSIEGDEEQQWIDAREAVSAREDEAHEGVPDGSGRETQRAAAAQTAPQGYTVRLTTAAALHGGGQHSSPAPMCFGKGRGFFTRSTGWDRLSHLAASGSTARRPWTSPRPPAAGRSCCRRCKSWGIASETGSGPHFPLRGRNLLRVFPVRGWAWIGACTDLCAQRNNCAVEGDSPIFADTKIGTVPGLQSGNWA